jgi:hypothetical protein
LSFRRKEKSSQVTPQQKSNLCRASYEDFSLRRNDNIMLKMFFIEKNTFLMVRETSQNQGLLKIKAKTLDNAYLTIVYLQPI